MTGKEKVRAAFSKEGTAEIPAVICYEGIFVRDHWEQITDYPWWYLFAPSLEQQLAWHRHLLERIPADWFSMPHWYSAEERDGLRLAPGDDEVILENGRTGKRRRIERPGVAGENKFRAMIAAGYSAAKPKMPDDRDAIDRELECGKYAVASDVALAGGCADLARALVEGPARDLYPLGSIPSPLWRCLARWNFEETMMMCLTNPEPVRHAVSRLTEQAVASVAAAKALGAEGIWIEECMTDMLGPAQFESLQVPGMQALTSEIRAHGMRSIYYYCGNPAGKWDLILESGADVLSLEESKKTFNIDIEDVVRRVQGRCALLGNLDAIGVLQDGSNEMLRREIARQIAAGRHNGNRFAMSLGSPITPATPVERIRRYCQITHELGGDHV